MGESKDSPKARSFPHPFWEMVSRWNHFERVGKEQVWSPFPTVTHNRWVPKIGDGNDGPKRPEFPYLP
jgi:hypothetical protein